MKSTNQQPHLWVYIAVAIVGTSLVLGQIRGCMHKVRKEAVQQILLREYGDAIQDYRSDPIRFRARIQELVRQGRLTQQEAEECIELVRKMSQAMP